MPIPYSHCIRKNEKQRPPPSDYMSLAPQEVESAHELAVEEMK